MNCRWAEVYPITPVGRPPEIVTPYGVMMTTTDQISLSTDSQTPRRRRILAVGAAVLAPSVLWFAAMILRIELKVDMNNGQPPMVIGLPLVLVFSLVFSVLGWATLATMERFTSRAKMIWTVFAATILVLSLMPIAFAQATAGTKTILTLMHVAVAAVLIPVLPRKQPRV